MNRFIRIHLILIFVLVQSIQAQFLVNKGQVITISPNAILTVVGGVRNDGSLINNGSLLVSEDWINTRSYNEGKGTVILNGTSKQIVRHNKQAFSILQIEGGGEKVFEEDTEINERLDLQNGLVSPAPGKIFLVTASAKITGSSSQSYVNGRLCHDGTGYKLFPIGKNGHFSPVILDNLQGVSPVTGFEMFEPNPDATAGHGLGSVSQARYWERTLIEGSFKEAILTLSFDETENINELDSVVVAEFDTESSTYRSLGKEAVTGTVTEGRITTKIPITGNRFAIGKASASKTDNVLYTPNVFAPASSNPEERVWKVYGVEIEVESLFLRIYNRWGNLVYENSSYETIMSEGWSGLSSTGQEENPGVYTYTLTGKFTTGKLINKTGTITLIR